MSDFLSVRDLVREYPQGETPLPVLRGINLDVREGEFLVIVGSSGAGKSTLLHIMGLLDTPTSGAVLFGDRNLTTLSEREQSRLRNTLFGFVFQFFHLLPDFTALENVLVPAMVGVGPLAWARRRKDAAERKVSTPIPAVRSNIPMASQTAVSSSTTKTVCSSCRSIN